MIQFQNVSAGYAGRTVVREVSFTVPRGSVASLIGPNGQGKTTLLRTAGGLLKPQAGRVLLNGKPAGDYRRRELAQLAAVLPQVRETPAITVERLRWEDLPQALRSCYHQETCNGMNYRRAAEETLDLCLQKLFGRLAEQSYRRAEEVLALLGCLIC